MTSIVVPVLSEGPALRKNIPRLLSLRGLHELIVVDGGSDDEGPALASNLGARVVESEPGRGVQMNRGARAASGKNLLFLHADCWLDDGALEEVERILGDESVVAGVFRQSIEGRRWAYRIIESAAALRTTWLASPYGDSGLFLRRQVFEAVGGFPDVPLCEDLGIAKRLRGRGRLVLAESRVHLSPRRWEERGIARTTLLNWWVKLSYRFGVSPSNLYRTYYGQSTPASNGRES